MKIIVLNQYTWAMFFFYIIEKAIMYENYAVSQYISAMPFFIWLYLDYTKKINSHWFGLV